MNAGTDRDSAVPGILGPAQEPTLQTRSFAENSNDSYWLANPARPLTGSPPSSATPARRGACAPAARWP
jgi:hypothetical protein